MRKLILKMEVTIDGFVGEAGGDPAWPVAYYDDELAAHEADLLSLSRFLRHGPPGV